VFINPIKLSQYRAVAEVTAPYNIPILQGLDQAFRETNHIDVEWWENKTVEKMVIGNVRSTSVGDLVEDLSTGKFWLCDSFGWKQVNPDLD